MQKGEFIVGSIDKSDNSVSFASYPAVHNTEKIARAEAERLALKYPERKFVVAEIKGIATSSKIHWE